MPPFKLLRLVKNLECNTGRRECRVMQWNGDELITIIRLWGPLVWCKTLGEEWDSLICKDFAICSSHRCDLRYSVLTFFFCVRYILCFCSGNAPCIYSSMVKVTTHSDWLFRCCRCKSECSFQCECQCAVCVIGNYSSCSNVCVWWFCTSSPVTYPLLIFSNPVWIIFCSFSRDTFSSFAA